MAFYNHGAFPMKTTRLLIAAIVLCTAGAARADNETIAVFTKNQTNPFFNNVRVGAESAARQLGARIIQYVPTKPDSIPEQMSQVEDVIVKKPNAIVFTPVDYKALIPAVEKMNAAGIPVVNVTDHMAGGKIVSFVGIDDYKVGRATAEALMKALGGKGNVVIIEGVKGSLSNQDRTRGLTDVTKAYPNVKLLATQAGNFQRLNALQVMENLMQSFPQIDGVMAANDAMAIGAIEALDAANRKATVVGINGTKEAVDAIKAGKLLASGQADPFMQGCLATMMAIRHLRNQPIVTEMFLPPSVIDTGNYKDFDMPVEARACPKWETVATN
jgi:ribose transport system substrate-binding protein